MNFTTQALVNEYKDKDLIDITIGLSNQIEWLEKADLKRLAKSQKIEEATIQAYLKNVKDLSNYFGSGILPAGKNFKAFSPIVQNLVEKLQYKKDALKDFE